MQTQLVRQSVATSLALDLKAELERGGYSVGIQLGLGQRWLVLRNQQKKTVVSIAAPGRGDSVTLSSLRELARRFGEKLKANKGDIICA